MRAFIIPGAACIALGAAVLAAPAVGQQSGAAAVAARKANYKEIGGAFKSINDELRSGSPDMNSLRPATRDIAQRAQVTLRHFPRNSAPGAGIKTRAKAEIWSNQAAFVKIQNEMIAAAKALDVAAGANDVAAIKKARDTLGGTCKSCHDRFREPD
jgi:Cytochrome c556